MYGSFRYSDNSLICAAWRRMCDPTNVAALGEKARRHAELLTWDAIAQRVVRALDLAVPGVDLAEFL